jgi:hypothetical protein
MLTSKTLKYLAGLTAVLFIASWAMGDDNDVLWILDDVVWYGLLLCALTLIVLSATVLVRHLSSPARRAEHSTK